MKCQHKNLTIMESGLVIHTLYPHLGASRDGIVCCDYCDIGVLKVKCPFSA